MLNDELKHAIINSNSEDIILLQLQNATDTDYENLASDIRELVNRHDIKIPFLIISDKISVKLLSENALIKIRDKINKTLEEKTGEGIQKNYEIKGCYHVCPFFHSTSNEMSCGHPYWSDKGAYENMIITQENSKNGNIPKKCPLKKSSYSINYKLQEK